MLLITLREKKGGQEGNGDPRGPQVLLPKQEAALLLGTPSSMKQVLNGENQGHT